MYPRSLWNSASSSSHRRRIFASVSGFMRPPFAPGKATLNRSSWRRMRSIKASPSSYVIGRSVWANSMTCGVDINPSLESAFLVPDSASPIMPERSAVAKQIATDMETRGGQGCDISAWLLWQVRNFYRWYSGSNSAARCRTLLFDEKPFELCKGDLSIRIFSSRSCGVGEPLTTTFSASGGRC